MKLKQLFADDDAVSPVIGVILMVAITVILAAVIASFVLGLGDQAQQTTPQASFTFDYDGGSNELTITHDGGDTIEAQELFVRGNNLGDTGSWDSIGSYKSTSEISAGNDLTISGTSSDYEANVVYEALEGDNSATLASKKGPDA